MKIKTLIGGIVLLCAAMSASSQEWTQVNTVDIYNTDLGNVGIGTNTTPSYRLDVYSGDINISSNQFYRIGGTHMLSNDGTRNLFVGEGANSGSVSGVDNVNMGYDAGAALTSGGQNVSVGSRAGNDITTGDGNVSIGYFAGAGNTTGENGTFVGTQAGLACDGEDNNTYIGWRSGYTHISGINNSSIGARAGESNDGNGTTAVGFKAGLFANGNRNTYLGYETGPQAGGGSSLDNTTAIGARAIATANNSLILGGITGINSGVSVNVGIGTTAPANRLEIVKGTAGQSGLRLTNLAGATPSASNGKVLSVDANGDVIVQEGGLIGYCSMLPELTNDAGVDLDSNNFYFKTPDSMNIANVNRVGIGVDCGDSLFARLDVRDNGSGFPLPSTLYDVNNIAINAISIGASGDGLDRGGIVTLVDGYGSESIGMLTIAQGPSTDNFGIKAKAGGNSTNNYAGDFATYGGGDFNYGVNADAHGDDTENNGVYGQANGSATTCFGVRGEAYCDDALTTNYGVYGDANNGNVDYAGYFNGDLAYTGSLLNLSDRRFKSGIADIKEGLSIIMQLQPKEYFFKNDEYPSMNMSTVKSFGLIAQEVEAVLPEIVKTVSHPAKYDHEGKLLFDQVDYIGVMYTSLIPFTIQAIKEQQVIIEEKEERISKLEDELEALKAQVAQLVETGAISNGTDEGNSTATATELHAEVRDLPVLAQNTPNPFTENTTIRFYLPQGSKNAHIKVFDRNGAVLRMFSLTGEGTGSIEIEGGAMAAGSYYYSLVVDGYQVDSKTLVLTK